MNHRHLLPNEIDLLVDGEAGAIDALGDALATARPPYCPEIF